MRGRSISRAGSKHSARSISQKSHSLTLDASINRRTMTIAPNDDINQSPSRTKRLKRSNSEKKRNMMKKLNAYYQTLVGPCNNYAVEHAS